MGSIFWFFKSLVNNIVYEKMRFWPLTKWGDEISEHQSKSSLAVQMVNTQPAHLIKPARARSVFAGVG